MKNEQIEMSLKSDPEFPVIDITSEPLLFELFDANKTNKFTTLVSQILDQFEPISILAFKLGHIEQTHWRNPSQLIRNLRISYAPILTHWPHTKTNLQLSAKPPHTYLLFAKFPITRSTIESLTKLN